MTKEKFRELCEQILVPRLGDLLHTQLAEFEATLDILARELVRIGDRLDRVVMYLNRHDSHDDHTS